MTKCELLDGFAIIIQGILALVAFSSLLIKRQRETPRRPLMIWMMDTSKQALGASFIHFMNILFSLDAEVNPCGQYILNIILDTTIGVYILLIIHSSMYRLVNRWVGISSGYYGGESPQLKIWMGQFLIYLIALTSMKFLVLLIIKFGHFGEIVETLLFSMNEKVQIVLVMFIIPLIMNVVQFWLIDQGIKFMTVQRYLEIVDEETIDAGSEKDE
eukprot:NODE_320_length_11094_cov_0.618190.p4 type:complete len:215 gc:universal NODE_320_length_11094_cov_0.618190:3164-3808(+)